jgi:hypothetical protein
VVGEPASSARPLLAAISILGLSSACIGVAARRERSVTGASALDPPLLFPSAA